MIGTKAACFFRNLSLSTAGMFGEANVHLQLKNLVRRAYPQLDQKGCDTVYENILECVKYKEHVWTFFNVLDENISH